MNIKKKVKNMTNEYRYFSNDTLQELTDCLF